MDVQPTDIKQLMAGMRFEPKTAQQWRQAEEGAAAMDADWTAQLMPRYVTFLGGVTGVELHPDHSTYHLAGPYYRAAYELRYHELLRESGLLSRR